MPLTRAGAAVEHASLARYPLRNAQAAIRRVWTGYTRRLGLDAATRTDRLVRTSRYVGARILARAVEISQESATRPFARYARLRSARRSSLLRTSPPSSCSGSVPGGWSWVRRSPPGRARGGTDHLAQSYSWLGSPSFRLPRSDARMLPPDIAHAELVAALTDQLYRDFYTVGRVEPIDPSRVVVLHSTGASAFTHSLEAAAAGVVRHTGWTVEGIWRNRVVITRDGLRVWARPDRTTCDGEPVPGRSASLLVAARSTTVSPGFVTVFGRDGQGCSDVAGTVRLYWNLRYRAAARFLGLLRAELDRAGVAFLVKALLDVSGYGLRRDTAVLYLTATDFTRAGPVLRTVVDRLADGLRPGVPAFTKELARGLGVAECPEGVASFGQTRCRALAESLVDDHRTQPRASADARLTAVITHLVAAGVRPDAPHLNPGSTADYQLPELARTRRRRRAVPPCSSASVIGSVARQLCDEAVWHDGRCNWVGAVSADSAPVGAFGALGPDVYDGTSGIALFLAEAAAVLDDKRVMRTAIGAARQALAVTTAADPDWMSTGFYRGTTGVAFAAARVGVLSGLVELVDRAVRVVADHDDWGESSDVNDLFAGHAGRIVGLLALARMMGDDDLLRRAARAGDRCSTEPNGPDAAAGTGPRRQRRGLPV